MRARPPRATRQGLHWPAGRAQEVRAQAVRQRQQHRARRRLLLELAAALMPEASPLRLASLWHMHHAVSSARGEREDRGLKTPPRTESVLAGSLVS